MVVSSDDLCLGSDKSYHRLFIGLFSYEHRTLENIAQRRNIGV